MGSPVGTPAPGRFVTVDDLDPWLERGAEVVRALLAREALSAELRALLVAIARYFDP